MNQLKEAKQDLIQFAETRPPNSYRDGYVDGVKIVFKKVNETIEFYNKYKSKLQAFHDIYGAKLNKEDLQEVTNCLEFDDFESFQTWLFSYCFGDVTE